MRKEATTQGGDREGARQQCSLWLDQTLSWAVSVCFSRGLWTQHPGWQPQFLFLPIAVPMVFPDQIVAQPQRTPSKASAALTLGWRVTGLCSPQPHCVLQSPHRRLFSKGGSASPLAPGRCMEEGALARQEQVLPQHWSFEKQALWFCAFAPVPTTRPPGWTNLTRQQHLQWPLWHIFKARQLRSPGGNGRRSS